MAKEVWKDVPGFESKYAISDLGRIKSLEKIIERYGRNGLIHTVSRPERILTPKKRSGYLAVQLSTNFSHRKFYSIHRLVLQTFVPNLQNKPQVNHINGDKYDNRLENLEWNTGTENQLHRHRILKR